MNKIMMMLALGMSFSTSPAWSNDNFVSNDQYVIRAEKAQNGKFTFRPVEFTEDMLGQALILNRRAIIAWRNFTDEGCLLQISVMNKITEYQMSAYGGGSDGFLLVNPSVGEIIQYWCKHRPFERGFIIGGERK